MKPTLHRFPFPLFAFIPLILLEPAFAEAPADTSSMPIAASHSDVILLIVFVSLALVVSFLCSIAEAVLLSITPSYIEDLKSKHPKLATLLQRLKQDKVDQSLAAILTLNTIAHTVGALGAGAKATVVFGSAWFGVFSAVMTLMILFLSEIIPKTIGVVYWSRLVRPTAYFVYMLTILLFPIVWLSEKLTRLFAQGKELHLFSRDELIAMARVGEQTGHIHNRETRAIRNLLRFESLKIVDIMTPRTVITALPEDMAIKDALPEVTQSPFSRLPVYQTDIDDISGFVLKDDILLGKAQGRGEQKLKSLKRDIHTVPESASLSSLLERLLKDHQHIAMVVDEYGGTIGLVTLEDLVETLTGMEIMDETDNVEDMRALARKQWAERAKKLGLDTNTIEHQSRGAVSSETDHQQH
jgi:CBS domain containing-hemolysin-like protein